MSRLLEFLKKGLAGTSGKILIRRLWLVPVVATVLILIFYNVRTFGLSGRVEKAIGNYKKLETDIVASLGTPNKAIAEASKKILSPERPIAVDASVSGYSGTVGPVLEISGIRPAIRSGKPKLCRSAPRI